MIEQRLMGLNGDEAAAYAAKQARCDVVAAYPITPQTIIVERYSEFYANGEIEGEFVPVESEHSAMSACVGASACGARAYTSTAANGLALMHEIVFAAASLRLPIVMSVVNRALSAPICIHCDHGDTMAERDSSWIQLYTVDAQESYDTVLQAFRIAEHHQVLLPTMVMMDGFIVSHTLQNVYMLPDGDAAEFVGPERVVPKINVPYIGNVPFALDPANPITMGPLDLWDYYFEHKLQQEEAINHAKEIIQQVNKEYCDLTGRYYGDGLIEGYEMDGAERVVVCMSSTYGTAKTVVRDLRANGEKVGLLRIRCYRPFPSEEIQTILRDVQGIATLDRCISPGARGAPLFNEIRSLFYGSEGPKIIGYTYGLGGRDMSRELIHQAYDELKTKPCGYYGYLGVRR